MTRTVSLRRGRRRVTVGSCRVRVPSLVSSASRTSGFDGIRKLNVDPCPSVLSTAISPPIISQNRRLIARPSPVPPYLRVVEASACVKSWNSRSICSAVMPMPVSLTRKCIQSPAVDAARATSSQIVAVLGELAGVAEQVEQDLPHLGHVGAHRPELVGAADLAACCRSSRPAAERSSPRPRPCAATSKVSTNSSILPASIFERSRMSLMSDSRCLPAE